MAFEAIHSWVRRIAEQYPDQIAVEGPQGDLNYAQLEGAASRLAAALRAAGADPGAVIAVPATDRRVVVTAMLGILKIGGIFVPIDPETPTVRLGRQFDLLKPRWVVLAEETDDGGAAVARLHAPAADRIVAEFTGDPVDAQWHESEPDDPCYIYFTSGSTGLPKGIIGRLQAIDHYIRWEIEALDVRPGVRVSQLASPAFDAMLRDVFLPLCTGGTVCVPPPEVKRDPNALTRWIADRRINIVHCVPSVFRGIVDSVMSGDHRLPDLRCVAMAGESISPADVQQWFDVYGDQVRLLNLYGPSETTMTKTFHFISPADAELAAIPIGRPIPGAEVLLLDDRDQPSEPGGIGEICLRTSLRSLGYFQQPEATASVFVPNPITEDPDDIIYRTGDFGRLPPGGELQFIGRRDHQVKIGGVRIELGDVENALREHPAVRDAAVVLADGADDIPYLCAFLEVAGELEQEEARRHLEPRLAEIMVPTVFVPLPELPRTISGKIDRRALPAPTPARRRLPDHVAPRTLVEQSVAELWTGMLPIDEVGIRHPFFDVGGHSLLVMRMLTKVHERFGVRVSLQDFLAEPVIEALAGRIETALVADVSALPDLLADDSEDLVAQRDGS